MRRCRHWWRRRRLTYSRTNGGDLMSCRPCRRAWAEDMRKPGEAFCADCPDHEACWTGWPCGRVRLVARATLVARSSGHNKTNDGRTNHE